MWSAGCFVEKPWPLESQKPTSKPWPIRLLGLGIVFLRVVFCSAVSLLYEGTLYYLDVYSTAAPTGRGSAKLRVADVQR